MRASKAKARDSIEDVETAMLGLTVISAVMNYFVFNAGLAFALDATGAEANRCPDNSYSPCFGLRDVLIYTLLFALIGLFTGLVSKSEMPNGEETSYVANCILGIIGAVIGGLLWLTNRWTSWNATRVPEGSVYTYADSRYLLPGYLLSLIAASMMALLVLAAYRLIRYRDQR
jgi:uncharacterized membrane protein YeaQ/YmgE (transglycosylase-associated protein family)